MKKDELMERESGLHRKLTKGQLTMIGLGGAIGTGLFMGSAIAINYAGPAVIFSYVIAAIIAVIMMYSLSEMAVAHPTAGSFGVYAEKYISPWAGFTTRWTYWAAQVIAIGGEAVAVGIYMQYWFPGIPVWVWTLGFGAVLIFVNSRSVSNFGSIEYWFAMIKVVAIVAFIIFGIAAVLGIGTPAVGFANFTNHNGFMPHGFSGVWMAVLMAIFSFVGVEVVAVTAGEAQDPNKAVPRAMKTMVFRLIAFYFLAISIMLAVVPWINAGAKEITQSPFVQVFDHFGFAYAAGIMNFVVLTAALSSMNTNLYLTTRMIFSLSRGNYAPASLGKLNKSGTPVNALWLSSLGVIIAGIIAKFSPLAYNYLFGIALFGALYVWLITLISHLNFRKQWAKHGEELPVKAPFFPYLQIIGIILIAAVLITMGLDKDFWDISWIVGVPWLGFLTIIYFAKYKKMQIIRSNEIGEIHK
ncbi:L-asparagine transporter [Paenibacillus sp. yr247]|uniref:amino acid permease n=1 Tax=Paenibacillus sp. yr247 TaxID=1761880 RepID=UPI000887FBFA|nr:amino acid permease [Paenibacillus sp. yr247]SDO24031.1 L-asparagine transporter [Paenibacillus sp. yr247]